MISPAILKLHRENFITFHHYLSKHPLQSSAFKRVSVIHTAVSAAFFPILAEDTEAVIIKSYFFFNKTNFPQIPFAISIKLRLN